MDPILIAILLIALVCPISMWLMMRGNRRDRHHPEQTHHTGKENRPRAG